MLAPPDNHDLCELNHHGFTRSSVTGSGTRACYVKLSGTTVIIQLNTSRDMVWIVELKGLLKLHGSILLKCIFPSEKTFPIQRLW